MVVRVRNPKVLQLENVEMLKLTLRDVHTVNAVFGFVLLDVEAPNFVNVSDSNMCFSPNVGKYVFQHLYRFYYSKD